MRPSKSRQRRSYGVSAIDPTTYTVVTPSSQAVGCARPPRTGEIRHTSRSCCSIARSLGGRTRRAPRALSFAETEAIEVWSYMRTIVGLVVLSMMLAWSASLQSRQSSAPVVLRNIRVVDGAGSVALVNQTIVIEGAKISALGDSSRVQIPRGAEELDLAGHTALPGLVL